MVVGNHHRVHGRQFIQRGRRRLKAFHHKRQGRGMVAKHGVKNQRLPAQARHQAGVAKPDEFSLGMRREKIAPVGF